MTWLLVRRVLIILFWCALLATIAGALGDGPHNADQERHPPSRERPTADVQTGPSTEAETASDTATFIAYTQEQERVEYIRIETARLAAEEAAREAEAARVAAAQPTPVSAAPRAGNLPSSCDGHVVPAYIVQRESGCNYGAVNPTGCGGASCVGLYQFDLRHFTSGACSDLDWHDPAQQDECARRLSNNGTNLAPWGG